MTHDYISEPAFLIVELRYTLGQLEVQLGDPDLDRSAAAPSGDRTVSRILGGMLRYEQEYQARYARLLRCSPPPDEPGAGMTRSRELAWRRARTIAMLEQAGDDWPQPLLDAVKQQVGDDRRHVTKIAEHRIEMLDRRQERGGEEPRPAERPGD